MAIQTVHFASLTSFFAEIGRAANPQDVHALKLIMSIPAPKPVQSVEDTLSAGRQAVQDNQSLTAQSKIPAYFAALQELLDPKAARLEANHKHATTPKGNAEPMDAVRDLCR